MDSDRLTGRGTVRWLFVLLLVALAVLWMSQRVPAQAQSAEEGLSIFQAQCSACHTIGGGSLVGPDLEGVTTRRDRDWLVRWITEPDVMLAEGDPIATGMLAEFNGIPMPNQQLSDAQVESVVVYLESASGSGAQSTSSQTPLSGDAASGKGLFEGTIRFDAGGPPCLACHSVAGIGALGGGALGPDLTQAFDKYGAAGIVSVLADPPFPTMDSVFDERPLTEDELGDLSAFLGQAGVSERSSDALVQLVLLAGIGMAILLAVARFVWRDRLTEVRRPMISRSRTRIERYAGRGLVDGTPDMESR